MSDSREDSPDWLRSFQAPTYTAQDISSDSSLLPNESSDRADQTNSLSIERDNNLNSVLVENGDESPSSNIFQEKASGKKPKEDFNSSRRKKKRDGDGGDKDGRAPKKVSDELILALSSDSESSPDVKLTSKARRLHSQKNENDMDVTLVDTSEKSAPKKVQKEKSPKKKQKKEDDTLVEVNSTKDLQKEVGNGDLEAAEEGTTEKLMGSRVSTSSLSLVLPDKVQRSKALVECEGESIDLSGDMGAVGRVMVQDTPAGNNEMYFDLKGTIYRTSIVPSRTFCVVSFGQSEAKIEAIMNDFIKLTPQSNVYESETMVEGTLEGFSFDSEDETEKAPKNVSNPNQDEEGIEEQPNGKKAKGKAEKASGVDKKKGKSGGGKSHPKKRAPKKTQAPKRVKTRK